MVGVGGCRQVYGTSAGGVVADWDGIGRVLPLADGTGWAVGKLPAEEEEAESALRRLNNNPVGWTLVSTMAPPARMATGCSRVAAGMGSGTADPAAVVAGVAGATGG